MPPRVGNGRTAEMATCHMITPARCQVGGDDPCRPTFMWQIPPRANCHLASSIQPLKCAIAVAVRFHRLLAGSR